MREKDSVNTFLLTKTIISLFKKKPCIYVYQNCMLIYSCENCVIVKYYVTSSMILYKKNAVLEVIWFYGEILI